MSLLLGLMSGCGSDADSSTGFVPTPVTPGQLPLTRKGKLRVEAINSATDIEVLSAQSDQVLATFRTLPNGSFRLPELGKGNLRLRLRGLTKEGITVECYVDLGEPVEYLWMNIQSHLISLYRRRHPEATGQAAVDALRHTLGLNAWERLHNGNSTISSGFCPAVFLALAEQQGGFDAFCERMVEAVAARQVRSMRLTDNPYYGGPYLPHRPTLPQSILDWEIETINHLLQFVSTAPYTNRQSAHSIGRVIAMAGMRLETLASLADVGSQLSRLNQYSTSSATFQYFFVNLGSSDQADLMSIFAAIDSAFNGVIQLANTYANPTPGVPQPIDFHLANLFQGCQQAVLVGSRLPDYLQGTNGKTNLLHHAMHIVTRDLLPAYWAELSALSAEERDSYPLYPIRRDDLTQQLCDYFAVFQAYSFKLWVLQSEIANARCLPFTNAPYAISAALNSAATDITSAYSVLGRARGLYVPDPLGWGPLLADTSQQKLWTLDVNVDTLYAAENPIGEYSAYNYNAAYGTAGFVLPLEADFSTLYDIVQQVDDGASHDDNRTYNALLHLSFDGLRSPGTDDTFKHYWMHGSDPLLFFYEQYFDMTKNRLENDNNDSDRVFTICYMSEFVPQESGSFVLTGDDLDRALAQSPQILYLDLLDSSNLNAVSYAFHAHAYRAADGDSGRPPSNIGDFVSPLFDSTNLFLRYKLAQSNGPARTQLELRARQATDRNLSVSYQTLTTTSSTYHFRDPVVTSIMVSPQCYSVPGGTTRLALAVTGYLDNGEARDLIGSADLTWSFLAVQGDLTAQVVGNELQIDAGKGRCQLTLGATYQPADSAPLSDQTVLAFIF